MQDKLREDVHEISTFLDVNKSSPRSQNSAPQRSYLKTIVNKIVPSASSSSNIEFLLGKDNEGSNTLNDVFDMGLDGSLMTNVQNFRTMSTSRYRQYMTYDQMSEDSVISSALDLYADDSTLPNELNKRVWIESKDVRSKEIVQNIFNALGLEDDIWNIARDLALYGDVYFELFYDKNVPSADVKLIESYTKKLPDYTSKLLEVDNLKLSRSDGYVLTRTERVIDVENIFDLTVGGETVAFARIEETQIDVNSQYGYITPKNNATDIKYYPPDKFVHFSITQTGRMCEQFIVDLGSGNRIAFNIRRGKSMIHDVFRTQRDLQLLEYSIMLNRVSRSSILRILQIEVGSMSKTNIQNTLRRIKNIIEQKSMMNTESGDYKSYNSPGPIENFVYVPVKDGKGSISHQVIGGDVNIRDIADVDYYNNKLFAGLKIPKAFLGFEESLPGMGGGSTLTKQDARYGRTITRLQAFISTGIQNMLDLFLQNRGLYRLVGAYDVCMTPPYTVEEEERSTQFSNKMELAKSFMEVISSFTEVEGIEVNYSNLIDYVADKMFRDADIKKLLKAVAVPSGEKLGSISGGALDTDLDGGFNEPTGEDTDFEPGGTDEFSDTSSTDTGSTVQLGGEWNDLEI